MRELFANTRFYVRSPLCIVASPFHELPLIAVQPNKEQSPEKPVLIMYCPVYNYAVHQFNDERFECHLFTDYHASKDGAPSPALPRVNNLRLAIDLYGGWQKHAAQFREADYVIYHLSVLKGALDNNIYAGNDIITMGKLSPNTTPLKKLISFRKSYAHTTINAWQARCTLIEAPG
jgi:hypothetical protein